MCWRLCCPFRRTSIIKDDITNILIFGVTGMTGGAVLDAALGCAWFKVNGFTRANHGVLYEELIAKGVTVFTGDMNKPHTISPAMKDIDTVFLVTTYWESMNMDREYLQGVNVVNVAMENAVKHIIYVGTDYSILTATERCKYLEGKARIENYIISLGIPFTIVHLGFYFENFVSVFKPHATGKQKFAIALPMGDKALNCGSVMDFGQCISKIAIRPHSFVFKTIKFATAYLTVTEIAEKFDKYFQPRKFYNPKIPLAAYRSFTFEGAEEITTMFAHYRTVPEWNRSLVSELIPSFKTFEQWMKEHEKVIIDILEEQINKEYKGQARKVKTAPVASQPQSSWTLSAALGFTFSKSVRPNAPALSLTAQEAHRHSQRCRALAQYRQEKKAERKDRQRLSVIWSPSLSLHDSDKQDSAGIQNPP